MNAAERTAVTETTPAMAGVVRAPARQSIGAGGEG